MAGGLQYRGVAAVAGVLQLWAVATGLFRRNFSVQSKVHALQSCPRVLSSSEFVVGLITASWSEGAGACFAPGVTCLCSHCSCLNCISAHSLSFRRPAELTLFPSEDPLLESGTHPVFAGSQAIPQFLQLCRQGLWKCWPDMGSYPAPAVLGCVRVRGQLEALICFAGFRGMCLTSLSSGDSPTCPTMPS